MPFDAQSNMLECREMALSAGVENWDRMSGNEKACSNLNSERCEGDFGQGVWKGVRGVRCISRQQFINP
jgi:hypothetical protein